MGNVSLCYSIRIPPALLRGGGDLESSSSTKATIASGSGFGFLEPGRLKVTMVSESV